MQYDNYLIVSDYEGHCINVFDRDGNFVHKFGKQGQGEGQFNGPCDVFDLMRVEHMVTETRISAHAQ